MDQNIMDLDQNSGKKSRKRSRKLKAEQSQPFIPAAAAAAADSVDRQPGESAVSAVSNSGTNRDTRSKSPSSNSKATKKSRSPSPEPIKCDLSPSQSRMLGNLKMSVQNLGRSIQDVKSKLPEDEGRYRAPFKLSIEKAYENLQRILEEFKPDAQTSKLITSCDVVKLETALNIAQSQLTGHNQTYATWPEKPIRTLKSYANDIQPLRREIKSIGTRLVALHAELAAGPSLDVPLDESSIGIERLEQTTEALSAASVGERSTIGAPNAPFSFKTAVSNSSEDEKYQQAQYPAQEILEALHVDSLTKEAHAEIEEKIQAYAESRFEGADELTIRWEARRPIDATEADTPIWRKAQQAESVVRMLNLADEWYFKPGFQVMTCNIRLKDGPPQRFILMPPEGNESADLVVSLKRDLMKLSELYLAYAEAERKLIIYNGSSYITDLREREPAFTAMSEFMHQVIPQLQERERGLRGGDANNTVLEMVERITSPSCMEWYRQTLKFDNIFSDLDRRDITASQALESLYLQVAQIYKLSQTGQVDFYITHSLISKSASRLEQATGVRFTEGVGDDVSLEECDIGQLHREYITLALQHFASEFRPMHQEMAEVQRGIEEINGESRSLSIATAARYDTQFKKEIVYRTLMQLREKANMLKKAEELLWAFFEEPKEAGLGLIILARAYLMKHAPRVPIISLLEDKIKTPCNTLSEKLDSTLSKTSLELADLKMLAEAPYIAFVDTPGLLEQFAQMYKKHQEDLAHAQTYESNPEALRYIRTIEAKLGYAVVLSKYGDNTERGMVHELSELYEIFSDTLDNEHMTEKLDGYQVLKYHEHKVIGPGTEQSLSDELRQYLVAIREYVVTLDRKDQKIKSEIIQMYRVLAILQKEELTQNAALYREVRTAIEGCLDLVPASQDIPKRSYTNQTFWRYWQQLADVRQIESCTSPEAKEYFVNAYDAKYLEPGKSASRHPDLDARVGGMRNLIDDEARPIGRILRAYENKLCQDFPIFDQQMSVPESEQLRGLVAKLASLSKQIAKLVKLLERRELGEKDYRKYQEALLSIAAQEPSLEDSIEQAGYKTSLSFFDILSEQFPLLHQRHLEILREIEDKDKLLALEDSDDDDVELVSDKHKMPSSAPVRMNIQNEGSEATFQHNRPLITEIEEQPEVQSTPSALSARASKKPHPSIVLGGGDKHEDSNLVRGVRFEGLSLEDSDDDDVELVLGGRKGPPSAPVLMDIRDSAEYSESKTHTGPVINYELLSPQDLTDFVENHNSRSEDEEDLIDLGSATDEDSEDEEDLPRSRRRRSTRNHDGREIVSGTVEEFAVQMANIIKAIKLNKLSAVYDPETEQWSYKGVSEGHREKIGLVFVADEDFTCPEYVVGAVLSDMEKQNNDRGVLSKEEMARLNAAYVQPIMEEVLEAVSLISELRTLYIDSEDLQLREYQALQKHHKLLNDYLVALQEFAKDTQRPVYKRHQEYVQLHITTSVRDIFNQASALSKQRVDDIATMTRNIMDDSIVELQSKSRAVIDRDKALFKTVFTSPSSSRVDRECMPDTISMEQLVAAFAYGMSQHGGDNAGVSGTYTPYALGYSDFDLSYVTRVLCGEINAVGEHQLTQYQWFQKAAEYLQMDVGAVYGVSARLLHTKASPLDKTKDELRNQLQAYHRVAQMEADKRPQYNSVALAAFDARIQSFLREASDNSWELFRGTEYSQEYDLAVLARLDDLLAQREALLVEAGMPFPDANGNPEYPFFKAEAGTLCNYNLKKHVFKRKIEETDGEQRNIRYLPTTHEVAKATYPASGATAYWLDAVRAWLSHIMRDMWASLVRDKRAMNAIEGEMSVKGSKVVIYSDKTRTTNNWSRATLQTTSTHDKYKAFVLSRQLHQQKPTLTEPTKQASDTVSGSRRPPLHATSLLQRQTSQKSMMRPRRNSSDSESSW